MTVEGVIIPGEGEAVSLNPELHQQAVQEKARNKGWKPLEEYQGEAAEWIPAQEFLGREKLYNTIHDLRRQNTRLEKDISTISKHFSTMEESAYNRALKELKAKQEAAVENQDVATVNQVTEEISELKATRQVQKQEQTSQQGESPEFVSWRENNEWFEKDTEMREDAIAIGVGFAAKNGNKTQKDVLEYVTEKIKKIYPEKFQPKRALVKREPIVESGSGAVIDQTPAKKGQKKLTVGDLDETELSVMKTFVKRGVFKEAAEQRKITQQEVYLEDLAKRRGL